MKNYADRGECRKGGWGWGGGGLGGWVLPKILLREALP